MHAPVSTKKISMHLPIQLFDGMATTHAICPTVVVYMHNCIAGHIFALPQVKVTIMSTVYFGTQGAGIFHRIYQVQRLCVDAKRKKYRSGLL